MLRLAMPRLPPLRLTSLSEPLSEKIRLTIIKTLVLSLNHLPLAANWCLIEEAPPLEPLGD